MRKTKTYIFCLMLIVCTVCQAQKLSIKPYLLYHQSISKQNEPVFYYLYLRSFYGDYSVFPASSLSKDFTLATGLEYGLAIDYTFRNQLGIELGMGYFSSIGSSFASKTEPCTTEWDYHSIAVRPLFTYSVMKGKSIFTGKIGPTIHYTSVSMSCFGRMGPFSLLPDFVDEKNSTGTFANRMNLGYLIAFEYNYHLSKRLSLAMELGFEQYRYTPHKATVEYEGRFAFGRKQEGEDIILYVDRMVDELVPDISSYYYFPSENKMLKRSILFDSIYFGIGIKYNLWEK